MANHEGLRVSRGLSLCAVGRDGGRDHGDKGAVLGAGRK